MHVGISVILACIHPNRAVMQAPCMHAFMHLGMFYKGMHASERVHIYEYLKGQFNEIFVFPVFYIKRLVPESIDMPKSNFKFCRILVELFVPKISKYRLPLSLTG